MAGVQPQDTGFINTLIMGAWSFAGAVAKGTSDWTNPITGKFDFARFITGVAAAIILGEIALGIAIYFNLDMRLTGALASVLGYLGPAPVIGFIAPLFEKIKGNKLFGTTDSDDKKV